MLTGGGARVVADWASACFFTFGSPRLKHSRTSNERQRHQVVEIEKQESIAKNCCAPAVTCIDLNENVCVAGTAEGKVVIMR